MVSREEIIESLRIIKAQCSRGDNIRETVIKDMSLDSFLWIINYAISYIKDNKTDWEDWE